MLKPLTTNPRFGSLVTSPSASRMLSATRTGVRDTPNASARSRSGTRDPG